MLKVARAPAAVGPVGVVVSAAAAVLVLVTVVVVVVALMMVLLLVVVVLVVVLRVPLLGLVLRREAAGSVGCSSTTSEQSSWRLVSNKVVPPCQACSRKTLWGYRRHAKVYGVPMQHCAPWTPGKNESLAMRYLDCSADNSV